MLMELSKKKIVELVWDYKKITKESSDLWYKSDEINRHHYLEFLLYQTNILSKIKSAPERRAKINTLIDSCIERGYFREKKLLPNAPSYETHLILDIKGKEFIEPLRFVNTVLREYGELKSVLTAILLSSLFWGALYFLSDKFIFIIKKLYTN